MDREEGVGGRGKEEGCCLPLPRTMRLMTLAE